MGYGLHLNFHIRRKTIKFDIWHQENTATEKPLPAQGAMPAMTNS
jgi:hypothetical protein